jgi:hypothetical protein
VPDAISHLKYLVQPEAISACIVVLEHEPLRIVCVGDVLLFVDALVVDVVVNLVVVSIIVDVDEDRVVEEVRVVVVVDDCVFVP